MNTRRNFIAVISAAAASAQSPQETNNQKVNHMSDPSRRPKNYQGPPLGARPHHKERNRRNNGRRRDHDRSSQRYQRVGLCTRR